MKAHLFVTAFTYVDNYITPEVRQNLGSIEHFHHLQHTLKLLNTLNQSLLLLAYTIEGSFFDLHVTIRVKSQSIALY